MSSDLPRFILDAITAYFVESGDVFEKTSDDIRHELSFQNDWHYEEFPAITTEEVTLLQLLQASTGKLVSSGEDAVHTHIHYLIEVAFLEQEMLRAIQTLWPTTHSNDLTLAHVALMEEAVSDYLDQEGTAVFQAFSERVRQRSPHQESSSLTC